MDFVSICLRPAGDQDVAPARPRGATQRGRGWTGGGGASPQEDPLESYLWSTGPNLNYNVGLRQHEGNKGQEGETISNSFKIGQNHQSFTSPSV